MHIFQKFKGVMISCKALGILPPCYPTPLPASVSPQKQTAPPTVKAATHTPLSPTDQLMSAFPTVFDGHIRIIQSHIAITDAAKPFCVHMPRTIPFAYRDKLQAELHLLESQHIIASVTEALPWCAPFVMIPKKKSECV